MIDATGSLEPTKPTAKAADPFLGTESFRGSETGSPGIEPVPGWDRYPWLRAGFSTRRGGLSRIYGAHEQNLGWTGEDDPELVSRNRARFVSAVAAGSSLSLVTVQQIHGDLIVAVEDQTEPMMTSDGRARFRADGLLARHPTHLLGVLTADCVPVLVADTRTHAVAAFHAGWRGTLGRIVEQGVDQLGVRFGSRREDLVAAIGPCIRACCFAVGGEVRSAFEAQFAYAPRLFSEVCKVDRHGAAPQLHMDLAEANRSQLEAVGVAAEKIHVLAECTACTRLHDGARKYFSHRAERGVTGRMLSVIGATE